MWLTGHSKHLLLQQTRLRSQPKHLPWQLKHLLRKSPLPGGISPQRRSTRHSGKRLADDYMAAHPNVNIEITVLENEAFKTKLTTVMQSGEPPDIFQSWGGGVMNEYANAGLAEGYYR